MRIARHDRIPSAADPALYTRDIPMTSPVSLSISISVTTVLSTAIVPSPVPTTVPFTLVPVILDAVMGARAPNVSISVTLTVTLVALAWIDGVSRRRVASVRLTASMVAAAAFIQCISVAVTVAVVLARIRWVRVLWAHRSRVTRISNVLRGHWSEACSCGHRRSFVIVARLRLRNVRSEEGGLGRSVKRNGR